jgi:hypothetical protein
MIFLAIIVEGVETVENRVFSRNSEEKLFQGHCGKITGFSTAFRGIFPKNTFQHFFHRAFPVEMWKNFWVGGGLVGVKKISKIGLRRGDYQSPAV